MSDIVLAAATWTALLATGRRTKARADAFAALLPVNSTIELHDGSGPIRAITTGAWTVGSVQSDGRYPIRPGTFTDPETGAGTPTLAIVKDDLGAEVCRMAAGVNEGVFRLGAALEVSTPITGGTFVLLFATDDIPVAPPPEEPPVVENYIETLISDMALFHDGPCDVLEFISSWGSGAFPPDSYPMPASWTHGLMWFHIMEDTANISSTDAARAWRVADIGPVVATGSSSIDLWGSIENDLLPWVVTETGVSGATTDGYGATYSLAANLSTLVYTHSPQGVLLYIGENDIAAGRSAADTRDAIASIITSIHTNLPSAHVYLMSIKPSPNRVAYWSTMDACNALLHTLCAADSRATYIDVSSMLLSGGVPVAGYYSDGLHLNSTGYALWTAAIRPYVLASTYSGNQAPNTRIQCRDLQLWYMDLGGVWRLHRHNPRPGAYMPPISWGNESTALNNATWRDETNNGGGASLRDIGRLAYESHVWHAFTSPATLPAHLGLASAFVGRKILDNPDGADDRVACRILGAGAGDYYQDESVANGSTPKVVGGNVRPMGYARLKYFSNDWQLFGFYSIRTLSAAQIRGNPPPFIGV